jgi:hypothetical protein
MKFVFNVSIGLLLLGFVFSQAPNVTPQDTYKMLISDKNSFIIDVRTDVKIKFFKFHRQSGCGSENQKLTKLLG